jgi:predicted TPR repeat methyltransferase
METETQPMRDTAVAEFDAYSQSYADAVNRSVAFSGLKVDFFARVKVDYFIDLIDRLRPPATGAEVLDIGCGSAISHPMLAGRVASLSGVDVSRACIAQAAAQNPQNEYRLYDGLN